MEIFTHLWKVGEKRFFKSLPLAPFFTNFAALLALFTFSSAFAYVIVVVVSRLAHPYHPPPESPRKASDPNRAIPPPAPHRRHVEPRRRTAINASFYPSFVYILILRLVVARTLLRRRHLRRRRASVKGGPHRARRAQRRGNAKANESEQNDRSRTVDYTPHPKKKGLGHSIRQIHRSIIGGFIESKGNFPPIICDRSIDLGIGTESGSGDRHLSCRERGME